MCKMTPKQSKKLRIDTVKVFDNSNTKAPDEKNFGSGNQTKKNDVVITRKTSIQDLIKIKGGF